MEWLVWLGEALLPVIRRLLAFAITLFPTLWEWLLMWPIQVGWHVARALTGGRWPGFDLRDYQTLPFPAAAALFLIGSAVLMAPVVGMFLIGSR